tara:strand:+ start:541 stop:972 length:432 start_codon:yes stop_codon:yes gene_type:complete
MTTKNIARAREIMDYASLGSDRTFPHPLVRNLSYTENVQRIAEALEAFWLVDAIASHQSAVTRKLDVLDMRDFQVWYLRPPLAEGDSWDLEAWSDSPDDPAARMLAQQSIPYSDFPVEMTSSDHSDAFRLYVENGVLMLPPER